MDSTCPVCHNVIRSSVRFCGKCGAPAAAQVAWPPTPLAATLPAVIPRKPVSKFLRFVVGLVGAVIGMFLAINIAAIPVFIDQALHHMSQPNLILIVVAELIGLPIGAIFGAKIALKLIKSKESA